MNTFGIELEIVGLSPRESASALIRAGIEAQAEGYNHDTRPHWKVVADGSLGTRYQGGHTAEVVSPILNVTDFEQLRKVTNALKSAGARVNATCGTHVHIGGFNLEPSKVHRSAQFWNMCAGFTDALVSHSRRGDTRWAQRLNTTDMTRIQRGDFGDLDRYKSFNVVPINRLGTIEFRQHQGTLNATKLWAWADYCQAMVNYSQSDARLFIPNSLDELLTVLAEAGHLSSRESKLPTTARGGTGRVTPARSHR
jgi:hypothetical protein